MDARLLLNKMVEEIYEEKKALVLKEQAVEFLRRRLAAEDKNTDQTASTAETPSKEPSPMSLPQRVSAAVEFLADREFSVHDVARVFAEERLLIPPKAASKFSTELGKLCSAGTIVRTHKGGGSIPHRYRLARSTSDAKTGFAAFEGGLPAR